MAGPSSPYYRFGYQGARHPSSWFGGAGGIASARRAADTRDLGLVQLDESGLTPYSMHYPLEDWPALRTAGPEPLDPKALGLSPGQLFAGVGLYQLLVLGGLGYLNWRLFFRKKKNPSRSRRGTRSRRRRNPNRRKLPVPPGVRIPAYYAK